jgi:hypothetical protein
VYHVPPAEAAAGQPLVVEATVDRAWQSTLELHYRLLGADAWRTALFELRQEGTYSATVPADAIRPPGFEYHIASVARDGQASAHFASAADPYRVAILEPPASLARRQELALYHDRRSRARLAFEYIDYGSRRISRMGAESVSVPDRYLRGDIEATYRLLRFPLHSLRFGYTYLVGTTPETERGDGVCDMGLGDQDDDFCEYGAGFKAGGWVELELRFLRIVHLLVRGQVHAATRDFNWGTRDELRIGSELGSHVALGVEALRDVGTAVYFRLGWDTVPRLPMAATIEITDFPAPHRAAAVRLLYDVAYPMDNGLRLGLRAGYQARDQGIGGPTVGASVALDFDFGGGGQ